MQLYYDLVSFYKKSFHFLGRRTSLSQNPSIFKSDFGAAINFWGEKSMVDRDNRDRIKGPVTWQLKIKLMNWNFLKFWRRVTCTSFASWVSARPSRAYFLISSLVIYIGIVIQWHCRESWNPDSLILNKFKIFFNSRSATSWTQFIRSCNRLFKIYLNMTMQWVWNYCRCRWHSFWIQP